MAIKWKNEDEAKLQRAVHAFNEKVRYHKNKGVTHLPDKISVRELKKDIETRTDLNRELNRIKRFSKPGAETVIKTDSGLKLTKWEKNELSRQVGIINARRSNMKKKIGEMEATSRGKPLGYKRKEMDSVRMNELNPKKLDINKFRSKSELEAYKKTVAAQVKSQYFSQTAERFKFNYIQALYNTYGAKANKLIEKISAMNPNDVAKKLYSDQESTIKFMYEPLDHDATFEAVTSVWMGDQSGVEDEEFEI